MAIRAEQYDFFAPAARAFMMTASRYGVPYAALHRLAGEAAHIQVRVASLLDVVDASGQKTSRSETVALFNVDGYRGEFAARVPTNRLLPAPGIAGDNLPAATRALGARDSMRNQRLEPLVRADAERPLPLSDRARERHGDLSDVNFLRDFIQQNPDRLGQLIRGPFEIESFENSSGQQSMRMPPFMRNSNANPLTLSAWQYALLMEWVREVKSAVTPLVAGVAPAARPMPTFAARRRESTLARLGRRPQP